MNSRAEEGTIWPEWNSEAGQCEYCGENTRVKPDPFGGRPACRPCFYQIIDGETT